MSADKTECADQLVGLAPCLQHVQPGAGPRAAARLLRQVLGKSPKCLCVLVRDKDDPGLGIKINAVLALALALALPEACGATRANVSHCAPKDNSTATTNSPAQQATNGDGAAHRLPSARARAVA